MKEIFCCKVNKINYIYWFHVHQSNENTMTMAKSGSMPKERLVRWIEIELVSVSTWWENDDYCINLYANLVFILLHDNYG